VKSLQPHDTVVAIIRCVLEGLDLASTAAKLKELEVEDSTGKVADFRDGGVIARTLGQAGVRVDACAFGFKGKYIEAYTKACEKARRPGPP